MTAKLTRDAKPLTRRERALFKALLAGKSLTDAARAAGYSAKWPGQAGSQALRNIQKKAGDLFARHGLDDDSFMEKHIIPALNATEMKCFAHEGRVVYSRDLIAWGPRLEAIKLVARMKGLLREDAGEQKPAVKVVIIHAENRPARDPVQQAGGEEQRLRYGTHPA